MIISDRPLPENAIKKAQAANLTMTKKTNFLSMVMANNELKLANIMAATNDYPLLGSIMAKKSAASPINSINMPKTGFVYIDSRLLGQLKLKLGDTINIGQATFITQKILATLPSPGMTLINIAPRVLINAQDLAKTKVIKPGSRVLYVWYFKGKTEKVNAYMNWLKSSLDRQYRVVSAHQRNNTQEIMQTATRFINLSALACILFSGIAMAMSTSWFFTRQQTFIALLRTFGTPFSTIRSLYFFVLMLIAIFSIAAGLIIGTLIQASSASLLATSFGETLPAPNYTSLWLSISTGFLLILGFSLPRILIIYKIKPLSLFQGKIEALKDYNGLLYISSSLCVLLLLMLYTQDTFLTLTVATLILLSGALFWLFATGLKSLVGKLAKYCKGGIKLSLISFRQQSGALKGQLLAFSLVIMAAVFIGTLQQGIINNWIKKLPPKTPNYFFMNIAPNQVQDFKNTLHSLNISSKMLYPIVRARLIALNGKPILNTVPNSGKDNNALYRALNLSSVTLLPYKNKIVSGQWFEKNARNNITGVSVDAALAKTLGWRLGDRLTLKAGAQSLNTVITSTRQIDWNTFQPNFYLLVPPKSLSTYPTTYMTSLYINKDENNKINQIIARFPNVTVFDISAILNQVQEVLTKLSQVVIIMLLFVLLASVAILVSASQRAFYENKQRIALLKAFGARKSTIVISTFGHYLILGLACGIIGTLSANLGASILALWVFNINYHISLIASLLWPLIGMTIITLFGVLANVRLFNTSPTLLLNRLV